MWLVAARVQRQRTGGVLPFHYRFARDTCYQFTCESTRLAPPWLACAAEACRPDLLRHVSRLELVLVGAVGWCVLKNDNEEVRRRSALTPGN
jgi:hypothetical protein